jgi:hypothetical protein
MSFTRRVACVRFLGSRFLSMTPLAPACSPKRVRPGLFSFQLGAALGQPFMPEAVCEQPSSAPFNSQGETMLSKATLELIVSEIVAGYGKVIRVKGKLKAVGSR